MISLKRYTLVSDLKKGLTQEVCDKIANALTVDLRHFPDPNDRSPNDPLYFVSSEMVTKFANQLAQELDLPPVRRRSDVDIVHLLALCNYATSIGWADVHAAGGQMVLEARFATGQVDMSNTYTTYTGTIKVWVDLNIKEQSLYKLIVPTIHEQGNLRATVNITGVKYLPSRDDQPIPLQETSDCGFKVWQVHLTSPKIYLKFNNGSGILSTGWATDQVRNTEPDLHLFEVSYSVTEPTV